ncbi:hypothetical protein D3C79_822160 [compost metagenome]
MLTKIDAVDQKMLSDARATVEHINPFATIVEELSQSVRSKKAFAGASQRPLDATLPQCKLMLATAHPRIHVYQARLSEPDPGDAIDWLENITGCLGEKLLRCKALISTPERDLLMQTVGTAFSAPRLLRRQPTGSSVAIFITLDCDLNDLTQIPCTFSVSWLEEAR